MGTLMLEGFEGLASSSDWNLKHGGSSAGGFFTGRWGGTSKAVGVDAGGFTHTFPIAATPEVYLGGAFKAPGAGYQTAVLRAYRSGGVQCQLQIMANGSLALYRGSGSVLLAETAPSLIVSNAWNYYELYVKAHTTLGAFEVRLNGVTVLSGTGVNTAQTGIADVDQVGWPTAGAGQNLWDDLYCTDDRFLGDVRIEAIYPSSEGASSGFTPSTGTDNAAMVDDTTPDDDTTYVEASVVGTLDTYVFTDTASVVGEVKAVQWVTRARKDDSGTRSIRQVVRIGGTDYEGAAEKALSTSYDYAKDVLDENPDTSAPWTVSDINSAEFGFKVSS